MNKYTKELIDYLEKCEEEFIDSKALELEESQCVNRKVEYKLEEDLESLIRYSARGFIDVLEYKLATKLVIILKHWGEVEIDEVQIIIKDRLQEIQNIDNEKRRNS